MFLALSSGRTTLAITGGGLGLGYAFTNVAHKTVNHPISKVDNAVLEATKKINSQIIDNSKSDDGRTIKAAAGKLDIYIDLGKVILLPLVYQ